MLKHYQELLKYYITHRDNIMSLYNTVNNANTYSFEYKTLRKEIHLALQKTNDTIRQIELVVKEHNG